MFLGRNRPERQAARLSNAAVAQPDNLSSRRIERSATLPSPAQVGPEDRSQPHQLDRGLGSLRPEAQDVPDETRPSAAGARADLTLENPRFTNVESPSEGFASSGSRPNLSHRTARVILNFEAEQPNDLGLEVGQMVNIIHEVDRFWAYGSRSESNGEIRLGIFPKRNVQRFETRPTDPERPRVGSTPTRSQTVPILGSKRCPASCPLRQIAQVGLDHPLKPTSVGLDKSGFDATRAAPSDIFADLKPWQTRLIRLKHGSGIGLLECDLLTVDLIDSPGCAIAGSSEIVQYEALSYSWLSENPTARIRVNTLAWAVPTELASALLYLRSRDQDRYLWCDALCINQLNPEEKASQIKSMLRIFEKAERVVAWLGEPQSSSGQLVRAFELISPTDNIIDQDHDEPCLEALEGMTKALRSHLGSHWFLRTWIRQEVFAAKELVLCLGGHYMTFELFNEKLDAVHTLCNPQPQSRLTRPIEKPKTLFVLQREFRHFGTDRYDFASPDNLKEFSEHWLSVLSSGHLFGVTEPRDRIYGSLGILTSGAVKFFARLPRQIEGIVEKFPVSYDQDKHLGTVYGDVIKFLIDVTGMANALDFWRSSDFVREPCEGLASWATDWRYFDGAVLPSVLSYGGLYERTGFVNQSQQVYHRDSPLTLQGVRLTTSFRQIRALTSRSDGTRTDEPRLADQISGLFARDEKRPLTAWCEETADQFVMNAMYLDLRKIPQVLSSMQTGRYCLASAEDSGRPVVGPSDFVVPHDAQLGDIIVSFYGSQCLHLIRKHPEIKATHVYIGTVLPLTSDGLSPTSCHPWKEREGYSSFTVQKADHNGFMLSGETFALI